MGTREKSREFRKKGKKLLTVVEGWVRVGKGNNQKKDIAGQAREQVSGRTVKR